MDKEVHMTQSIAKIAPALVKAQSQMMGVVKEKANPFFKSKYADLSSVVEAVKQPLADNGLMFIQPAVTHVEGEGRIFAGVVTMIIHESGEYIKSTMYLPLVKLDPQGYGSAVTYARRYALQSFLGIPSEDDDGHKATHGNNAQAPVVHTLTADDKKAFKNDLEELEVWSFLTPEEVDSARNATTEKVLRDLKARAVARRMTDIQQKQAQLPEKDMAETETTIKKGKKNA